MLSQTEFLILKKLSELNFPRSRNIVIDDNSRFFAVVLIVRVLVNTTHVKSHTIQSSLANLYDACYVDESLAPTSKGLAVLDSYYKEKLKVDVLNYLPLLISTTSLVINIIWRAS